MEHNEKKVAFLVEKHKVVGSGSKDKSEEAVTKEEEDIIKHTVLDDDEVTKEELPKVPVYGEVSLDEDELAILRKPPKFAMYGQLQMIDIHCEVQAANAKIRWHRREAGYGDDDLEYFIEEDEEKQSELFTRETFDPATKTFDFRKKRATDVKTNQRIYLPEPRPFKEEAELTVRNEQWLEEVVKYRKSHCDEEGNIRECNLSRQEKSGLRKLRERVKSGEIVIGTTDKSGKLCVSSMEDRKSTRLNSSHSQQSRMPSSA